MDRTQGTSSGNFTLAAAGDGFAVPLAILGVFALFIARGIWLLPGGYSGDDGLNNIFAGIVLIWFAGTAVRWKLPASRAAAGLVAIALYVAISLSAALAAASNAIGGGDYVDPWLQAMDGWLFPFYDWKAVALELPRHEILYRVLNESYGSLSWQPMVYIITTVLFGEIRHLSRLVTAWGLGLLGCIAPFHWLPALSPIPYYGIDQGALPGHMVSLPWKFLPVMEGMRDGTIQSLGMECLTGMVTVPSFHACGATILIASFWHYKLLRWPFLFINLLMMIASVPIGSHYIIDIVIGIAVGVVAVAAAGVLNRAPRNRPVATIAGSGELQTA